MTNLRVGHGYDVHRLTEGRQLILGGVDVPYDRGLLGHSDADVLTHAVMDALLETRRRYAYFGAARPACAPVRGQSQSAANPAGPASYAKYSIRSGRGAL